MEEKELSKKVWIRGNKDNPEGVINALKQRGIHCNACEVDGNMPNAIYFISHNGMIRYYYDYEVAAECITQCFEEIYPIPKYKDSDLPIDTPVMVKTKSGGAWKLKLYCGNNRCKGLDDSCSSVLYYRNESIIIPFDKFNPNDIEGSLKHNIVK